MVYRASKARSSRERLEYAFSVVYFSRGTLHQKRAPDEEKFNFVQVQERLSELLGLAAQSEGNAKPKSCPNHP